MNLYRTFIFTFVVLESACYLVSAESSSTDYPEQCSGICKEDMEKESPETIETCVECILTASGGNPENEGRVENMRKEGDTSSIEIPEQCIYVCLEDKENDDTIESCKECIMKLIEADPESEESEENERNEEGEGLSMYDFPEQCAHICKENMESDETFETCKQCLIKVVKSMRENEEGGENERKLKLGGKSFWKKALKFAKITWQVMKPVVNNADLFLPHLLNEEIEGNERIDEGKDDVMYS